MIKKIIPFFITLLIVSGKLLAQPALEWAANIDPTNFGSFSTVHDMDVNSDGSVIAVGYLNGFFDITTSGAGQGASEGYADSYIYKLDDNGEFVWFQNWDITVGGVWFENIDIDDNGNIYITGSYSGEVDFDIGSGTSIQNSDTSSSAYIMKLNSAGDFQWVRSINGSRNVGGKFIEVFDNSRIIVLGTHRGTTDMDAGSDSVMLVVNGIEDQTFLTEYDSSGNFISAYQIESDLVNRPSGLSISNEGAIVFTGEFIGQIDCNWDTTIVDTIVSHPNSFDAFLIYVDSSLNFQFAKRFSGFYDKNWFGVEFDEFGNIYATAMIDNDTSYIDGNPNPLTSINSEAIVAIYEDNGALLDLLKFEESRLFITDIEFDNNKNIYFAGSYNDDLIDFDPDSGDYLFVDGNNFLSEGFVLQLDSNYNFVDLLTIETPSTWHSYTSYIELNANLDIFVTGNIESPSVDFDPSLNIFNLNAYSDGSMYVAKYSHCITYQDHTSEACQSYTSPNGSLWTETGIYTETYTSSLGCDSLLVYSIQIDAPDTSLSIIGNSIIVAHNDQYQWLDCNSNYSVLAQQQDSVFTPIVNGSYAVMLIDGNCIDTSRCVAIQGLGEEEVAGVVWSIFPNPSSGYVNFPSQVNPKQIKLIDINGRDITRLIKIEEEYMDLTYLPRGIYFIENNGTYFKVVLN